MEIAEARAFLTEHHRCVLSTARKDGRPQMSVVAAGVDAAGRAIISSREQAFKVRNLRRDPAVSLCVISADGWQWIQVDGQASVLSLPEAMEPLVDYYRRVSGEHSDWDDYRAAMERDERVLVRVDIERVGPNRSA